jgi:hypothetical protein
MPDGGGGYVTFTAQPAVEGLVDVTVHVLEGVKEPWLLATSENVTVPLGEVGVAERSLTVAVQWLGWL